MLGVFEDEVDCFIFKDNFPQGTQIPVMQFSIQLSVSLRATRLSGH